MFQDRWDAGEQISDVLTKYRREGALVLGLPRGGVVVASAISQRLGLPMDVFISQKLGAPWNPNLAMGAVTETGSIYLNDELLKRFRMPEDVLVDEVREQKFTVSQRRDLYREGRTLPSLKGRHILLVDDGIETGATMLAAIEGLRKLGPKSLVAVVPAGHLAALAAIEKAADELKVLKRSQDRRAISSHYDSFKPVTDAMVIETLAACRRQVIHKTNQRFLNDLEMSYA